MYGSAYDKTSGCFVVFLGKASLPRTEQTQLFVEMKRLNLENHGRADGVFSLVFVERGAPRPDSTWRKQLTAMINAPWPHRRFVALVSGSAVVRGVMTTLRWFTPTPPNYESSTHATISDAIRWAEARRGQKLPRLEALFQEARLRATIPT